MKRDVVRGDITLKYVKIIHDAGRARDARQRKEVILSYKHNIERCRSEPQNTTTYRYVNACGVKRGQHAMIIEDIIQPTLTIHPEAEARGAPRAQRERGAVKSERCNAAVARCAGTPSL